MISIFRKARRYFSTYVRNRIIFFSRHENCDNNCTENFWPTRDSYKSKILYFSIHVTTKNEKKRGIYINYDLYPSKTFPWIQMKHQTFFARFSRLSRRLNFRLSNWNHPKWKYKMSDWGKRLKRKLHYGVVKNFISQGLSSKSSPAIETIHQSLFRIISPAGKR